METCMWVVQLGKGKTSGCGMPSVAKLASASGDDGRWLCHIHIQKAHDSAIKHAVYYAKQEALTEFEGTVSDEMAESYREEGRKEIVQDMASAGHGITAGIDRRAVDVWRG